MWLTKVAAEAESPLQDNFQVKGLLHVSLCSSCGIETFVLDEKVMFDGWISDYCEM